MLDRIDYIVVPSYTVRSATEPTSQTQAALDLAHATYTTHLPANPSLKIILSTGDNQNLVISNARVMADYLIGNGLPEKALILEEKSRDTFENLQESRKIIESRATKSTHESTKSPTTAPPVRTSIKIPRIAIVAYDLHMRRIRLIARMQKWPSLEMTTWLSAPGPAESAYGWRAFQTSSRTAIKTYEWLALMYELIRWLFR